MSDGKTARNKYEPILTNNDQLSKNIIIMWADFKKYISNSPKMTSNNQPMIANNNQPLRTNKNQQLSPIILLLTLYDFPCNWWSLSALWGKGTAGLLRWQIQTTACVEIDWWSTTPRCSHDCDPNQKLAKCKWVFIEPESCSVSTRANAPL